MLYAVSFEKTLKLSTYKLSSIICDDNVWETEMRKNVAEGRDDSRRSSGGHLLHLDPFGMTITFGRPKREKMLWRVEMIAEEVVEVICSTSIHLECASTKIKNICPRNGPAKI